jgi:hypothetical protein
MPTGGPAPGLNVPTVRHRVGACAVMGAVEVSSALWSPDVPR